MTDWSIHGTERCLLCDFQGEFVYLGDPADLVVGTTWTEECVKCGFVTTHVHREPPDRGSSNTTTRVVDKPDGATPTTQPGAVA